MNILILDNYDSFTYNLFHYCEPHFDRVEVIRNDALTLDEVENFDAIILSPGPGLPSEAGIMPELIQRYFGQKPLLGVCLGHQALCEHAGGKLKNLESVWHGRTSVCTQRSPNVLFKGIAQEFEIGHYHSWVVEEPGTDMKVTAVNEFGWIMATENIAQKAIGVQFHPESVMTPDGRKMIENWANFVRR